MIKNNVLFGKDDYLFLYNGGQKQFDYLLGKEKVNKQCIDNFVANIENRTEYFNNKSITIGI